MPIVVSSTNSDTTPSESVEVNNFSVFKEKREDSENKKYALIINTDTESRHLENTEASVRELKAQGYETFVINPFALSDADHSYKTDHHTIKRVIKGMNRLIDANDELVIYSTGHGSGNKKADKFFESLDKLSYGKRTVIVDQCYGGNYYKFFSDDPSTYFVSAGVEGETVYCQEFAPYFWASNVPDADGNGEVSFGERYAYAEKHVQGSLAQAVGYDPSSGSSFPDSVVEVHNRAELQYQLSRLQKDQVAVMTFSASWCQPCKQFAPKFDAMASSTQGQVLFLRTENEDLAKEYGLTNYPTVVIFDHKQKAYPLKDYEKVFAALTEHQVSVEMDMGRITEELHSTESSIRIRALHKLAQVFNPSDEKQVKEVFGLLDEMLQTEQDPVAQERLYATYKAFYSQSHNDDAVESLLYAMVSENPVYATNAILTFLGIGRMSLRGDSLTQGAEVIAGQVDNPDPKVRKAATQAYYYKYFFSDEAKQKYLSQFLPLLSDPDAETRIMAARFLGTNASLLSPEQVMQCKAILEEDLASIPEKEDDWYKSSLMAYGEMAQALPPDKKDECLEVLRGIIFNDDIDFNTRSSFGIQAYSDASENLGPEVALQEEEKLRAYFGKNLYDLNHFETLNVLSFFYRNVAEQVPDAAIPSIVDNLFPYLNSDNNEATIDHAIDALDCYVPRMGEEQLVELNTHLLLLLNSPDPRVVINALDGYHRLIDRLPKQQADDVMDKIKILRQHPDQYVSGAAKRLTK